VVSGTSYPFTRLAAGDAFFPLVIAINANGRGPANQTTIGAGEGKHGLRRWWSMCRRCSTRRSRARSEAGSCRSLPELRQEPQRQTVGPLPRPRKFMIRTTMKITTKM